MASSFKLRIIETGHERCRVQAESYGEFADNGDQRILPNQFDEALAPLKTELRRTFDVRSVAIDDLDVLEGSAPNGLAAANDFVPGPNRVDLKITENVGSLLFNFLFDDKVGDLFRKSVERASRDDEALPVRLCIEHSPLSSIPWETLYDRESRTYLSLSRSTPLTRCVPGDDLEVRSQRLPIRILGMVSRPQSLAKARLGPIDAEGEIDELRKAMFPSQSEGRVAFRWTAAGAQSDLETTILRRPSSEPWSVFHFIGHGGYDPVVEKGYLIVQEEDGPDADLLYSDALRNILVGPGGPQLVVLNSCEGAYAPASGAPFSNMAADLLIGRIPAVVAMQFQIKDSVAKLFSRHFYKYLADGSSIEGAVALTRSALQRKTPQWMAPVVYLRTGNTTLFQP